MHFYSIPSDHRQTFLYSFRTISTTTIRDIEFFFFFLLKTFFNYFNNKVRYYYIQHLVTFDEKFIVYFIFSGGCRRTQDLLRVRATDPRPCPKCGKIYRSAHTLRTHLEDKHTVCPGYRYGLNLIIVSQSQKICFSYPHFLNFENHSYYLYPAFNFCICYLITFHFKKSQKYL